MDAETTDIEKFKMLMCLFRVGLAETCNGEFGTELAFTEMVFRSETRFFFKPDGQFSHLDI